MEYLIEGIVLALIVSIAGVTAYRWYKKTGTEGESRIEADLYQKNNEAFIERLSQIKSP